MAGLFESAELAKTLAQTDWKDSIHRALSLADGEMPGGVFLSPEGSIGFAETMAEVDGLMLYTALRGGEPGVLGQPEEDSLDLSLWLERDQPEIAEQIRIAWAARTV